MYTTPTYKAVQSYCLVKLKFILLIKFTNLNNAVRRGKATVSISFYCNKNESNKYQVYGYHFLTSVGN